MDHQLDNHLFPTLSNAVAVIAILPAAAAAAARLTARPPPASESVTPEADAEPWLAELVTALRR